MNAATTLMAHTMTGAAPVPAERREAERFSCVHSPLLQAVVRPNFAPVTVLVDDVSTKGVGLLCDEPLEPGVRIAVLWMCGPQDRWRTIRGRVTRAAPAPKGGWIVGCVFDERLQAGDVLALIGQERLPTMTGVRDLVDTNPPGTARRACGHEERRSSPRKPARENIRLQCRRAALGSGANLATRLVDISEGGVQMVAKESLTLREEVEVVLDGHGVHMPIQRAGVVRWIVPVAGAIWCVGVQFAKPLSSVDVQVLSGPA